MSLPIFRVDTGIRILSNMCPGEPGEAADDDGNHRIRKIYV